MNFNLLFSQLVSASLQCTTDPEVFYLLGKCICLLDLKKDKSSIEISSELPLVLKLWNYMALIVRGDQKGYTALKSIILQNSESDLPFIFGRVIAKARDNFLIKENGFHVFKLYKQRLFSTIYPVLIEIVNRMDQGTEECQLKHQRGVQLTMHACSLVPISTLNDKLQELVPVAE